jgi:hypothetical protein
MSYSNENERQLWANEQAKLSAREQKWNAMFGPGPQAGQAEVLFPRGTMFQVTAIERSRDAVMAVLEERQDPNPPARKKNMKTGTVA